MKTRIPNMLYIIGLCALIISCKGTGGENDEQRPKESERPSFAIPDSVNVEVIGPEGADYTAPQKRHMIIGPGHNQPDSFPGYLGFVGWSAPILLDDNTILVGFNAGYWHASPPTPVRAPKDSWIHKKPKVDAPTGGRMMQCISTDGGRTWGKPSTMIDTDADDRHPNFMRISDNEILCSFFMYFGVRGFVSDTFGARTALIRSVDNGRSWSQEPEFLPTPFAYGGTDGPGIRMDNGELALMVYGLRREADQVKNNYSQGLFVSGDEGHSWELRSEISSDHEMSESAIAQLPSGHLAVVIRRQGEIAWSPDSGHSWSRPIDFGFDMFEPSLFVLDDGTLVCTHGSYITGGLRVIFSTDGGKTWKAEGENYGFALDTTVYGYAKGIVLPDQSILLTYLDTGGHSHEDAANEAIWLLRFRIRDDKSGIEIIEAYL